MQNADFEIGRKSSSLYRLKLNVNEIFQRVQNVRYMTEVCLGLRRSAFSVDATHPLTSSSPAAMSWPSTSGQTTA